MVCIGSHLSEVIKVLDGYVFADIFWKAVEEKGVEKVSRFLEGGIALCLSRYMVSDPRGRAVVGGGWRGEGG